MQTLEDAIWSLINISNPSILARQMNIDTYTQHKHNKGANGGHRSPRELNSSYRHRDQGLLLYS